MWLLDYTNKAYESKIYLLSILLGKILECIEMPDIN